MEYFQPNVRLLDRDNIALMVKFRTKSQRKQVFVVATTHLLYNPNRQDVKLGQIALLMAG